MVLDLVYWTQASVTTNTTKEGEDSSDSRRLVSSSREEFVNIHDEDSTDPSKSCRYKIK